MADIYKYKKPNGSHLWAVRYFITTPNGKTRRAKYAKLREDAVVLLGTVVEIERATQQGYAPEDLIQSWVKRRFLREEEAKESFKYYADLQEQKRNLGIGSQSIDHDKIYEQFIERSSKNSKGGIKSRTHAANVSRAKKAIGWLKGEVQDLAKLTPQTISERFDKRAEELAPKTVVHELSILKLLLDEAVAMGMIKTNPAAFVHLKKPKKANPRKILSLEEIRQVLEASMRYQHLIYGGLPTALRLGLYAGMRDEEMVMLKWASVDLKSRIIEIKESISEAAGKEWVPKDSEFRRVDIKKDLADYLEREKLRQEREGILGDFILPSGHRQKPLHYDSPQKAFSKMVKQEGMNSEITLYCMRHTYATWALRSGVDIKTIQKNLGHADLKTTMEYLHYIEPEEHPMDDLPY